jgi:galactosylgalactosylxylosylprotein 3-beta-glucuronosyltransferase 3
MRHTRKVSVWPVAFVGELLYERPICQNGRVTGWFCGWGRNRVFPIDMAGFAVNLNLLLAHPSASFSQFVARGMQESHFLGKLVANMHDLEARADNCTKVKVPNGYNYLYAKIIHSSFI